MTNIELVKSELAVRNVILPDRIKLAQLQADDVYEAASAGRILLAYEVGSGKTLVSTCAAVLLGGKVTVTMPPILLDEWKIWLNECGITDVEIYRGPKRKPEQLNAQWVLVSHAIFRDDITAFVKARGRTTLIVDESQSLKNARSVLFKSVNTFVGADGNLVMCTATPTSKPPDTYAYMRLKTPELYRSYGHWSNLHIVDVDPFGQPTGYANLEMLAQNFAIKTIKRTKVDIFGPQIEPRVYPVRYALSAKHTKLYEKLVNEQLLLLPGGDKIDATTAQRLYHALQQIVINFAKFSGKPDDQSASLELLEETLSEVDPMTPGNSKLTVWTYYQSSSEVVYDYLVKKFGEKAVCIAYGKSNSREAVRRIMHDDSTRIMVAQASSVGVGLNLQHVCWEMLFLEYSTVPAQTRQALGRVDRVGQIHQANCRIGVALGTVQVNLLDRLLSNDDLVTKVEMTPTRLRDMLLGRT